MTKIPPSNCALAIPPAKNGQITPPLAFLEELQFEKIEVLESQKKKYGNENPFDLLLEHPDTAPLHKREIKQKVIQRSPSFDIERMLKNESPLVVLVKLFLYVALGIAIVLFILMKLCCDKNSHNAISDADAEKTKKPRE